MKVSSSFWVIQTAIWIKHIYWNFFHPVQSTIHESIPNGVRYNKFTVTLDHKATKIPELIDLSRGMLAGLEFEQLTTQSIICN